VGIRILPTILLFASCLYSSVRVQSETPPAPPKPRYLVLRVDRVGDLEWKLRLYATGGYQLVALSHGRHQWSHGEALILEKLPEGSEVPEYSIAGSEYAGTLEEEINDSARAGFRVVARSAFAQNIYHWSSVFWDSLFASLLHRNNYSGNRTITKESFVVMERKRIFDWPTKCTYLVPRTNFQLEDRKAKRALAEGRRLVGAVYGEDLFLIMEQCPNAFDGAQGTGTEPAPGDPVSRYRTIKTENRARAQKQLDEAAAKGYRIFLADGGVLALEKTAPPASRREYRIVSEESLSTLEQELNSAKGFRMVPDTMSVIEKGFHAKRRISVVLEKASNGSAGYLYRVLSDRTHTTVDLQDEVNAAAEQHYGVKGVTHDHTETAVIMERPLPEDADPKP
jgi:hypothetical protein